MNSGFSHLKEDHQKQVRKITYFLYAALTPLIRSETTNSPGGPGPNVFAISGSIALGVFLLLCASIAFCMWKRRKARIAAEAEVEIDENPTYGDCYDPYAVVEVEDSNDYYYSA